MNTGDVLSAHIAKITFAPPTVFEVDTIATSALNPRQIKGRSGCLTYKRRREKCDDAKPSYQNYNKRGITYEWAANIDQ